MANGETARILLRNLEKWIDEAIVNADGYKWLKKDALERLRLASLKRKQLSVTFLEIINQKGNYEKTDCLGWMICSELQKNGDIVNDFIPALKKIESFLQSEEWQDSERAKEEERREKHNARVDAWLKAIRQKGK